MVGIILKFRGHVSLQDYLKSLKKMFENPACTNCVITPTIPAIQFLVLFSPYQEQLIFSEMVYTLSTFKVVGDNAES